MDTDIYSAVIQFTQSYWGICKTLSTAIGVGLFGLGIASLNKRRQEGGGWAVGFTGIILGAAFINLPAWIDMWSVTLMGVQSSTDALAYGGAGATGSGAGIKAILGILGAVGSYGVIKGLLLCRESVYDRQAFWPGVRHTLGGVFGINFSTAAQLLIPLVPGPVQNLLSLLHQ